MKLAKFFLMISVCLAVVAPLLPFDPQNVDLLAVKLAPSYEHILGTDFLGRDEFARLSYALRNSLVIGVLSGIFSMILAGVFVFITLNSPVYVQTIMMRVLDAFLGLPNLLLILLVSSIVPRGLNIFFLSLLIGIFLFPSIAKVANDEFHSISKSEFIANAVGLGASRFSLFFREILPVVKNIIFVLFITCTSHAISTEAVISFFGVGLSQDEVSLGLMLNEAAKAIFLGAWWMVLTPAIAIFGIVLSLMLIGQKIGGES